VKSENVTKLPVTKNMCHFEDSPEPLHRFLLSTYEIWKVLVALVKKYFFSQVSRLRTFYKKFRLSRGVAGCGWMKFEAQLAQPC
jgi:hypothetical protein